MQSALRHVQVQLIDKPAIAVSQRMSQGIWNCTAPYLGAALLLALAALASSATHALPSGLTPVAAAASLSVFSKGVFSVLAPLSEIRQLSKMSAQQIEAAVDLSEPLQVVSCGSFATFNGAVQAISVQLKHARRTAALGSC